MQRLRDERGAVAVMVALLMIPLIGFAAIAIDVAAMWSEHQQLQTAADAGALAVAQDCARGTCGSPAAETSAETARSLAKLNVNGEHPTGRVCSSSSRKDPCSSEPTTAELLTAREVTVRTSDVKAHWFAPVIGVDQSDITAQATATWRAPTGSTSVVPLAFNRCEFDSQTGGPSDTQERTILFSKTSDTPECNKPPSNNFVPGGFAWVKPDQGSCAMTSLIHDVLPSDPGNSRPSACSVADFAALKGQVVLLPIFDEVGGGTGNNATYRVYGYAAFMFTGYHFGGQYSTCSKPKDCSGPDHWVRGYFTRFVALDEASDLGVEAPQLGASVVALKD